ncbi:MAG: hypothetical protein ACD_9C00020G0003 [uncultured bacterium]|nr:MAG: hypothetical protein ACD_9C00020G0003 [uncultured bacterium]
MNFQFLNFQKNIEKILEIGTYAVIFLLPWQTRWIFETGKIDGIANEFFAGSIYVLDIFIIALLVLAIFHLGKKIRVNGKLETKILFLFTVFIIISILFAENKMLAWLFGLRLFLATALFWLIINFTEKTKRIVFFVVGMIAPAILGIWQFLSQKTFSFKWLGISEHVASVGGTSIIETYTNGLVSQRWLRAYGSFDHPNILGAVMVVGLLLAFYLLIEWKKESWKFSQMLFIYLAIVIFAAALFASFSRSAWIALVLGMFFYGAALLYKKKFSEIKIFIHGILIVFAVFSLMFVKFGDLAYVRIEAKERLENLSIDQRVLYIEQSKNIIKGSSFLGVGPGNYVFALSELYPNKKSWDYQPVHNVFLLIRSELGIIGLLFVGLCALLLWRQRNFYMGFLLISLIPAMMFDHWIWSLHFGLVFFAVVTAIAVGFYKKEGL